MWSLKYPTCPHKSNACLLSQRTQQKSAARVVALHAKRVARGQDNGNRWGRGRKSAGNYDGDEDEESLLDEESSRTSSSSRASSRREPMAETPETLEAPLQAESRPRPGPRQRGGSGEGGATTGFRAWLEERLRKDGGERRYLSEEELLGFRQIYSDFMSKRARIYTRTTTRDIKTARSWQQVGMILQQRESILDAIHLTAMVQRLCQLQEDGWVGNMEVSEFERLLDAVLQRLLVVRDMLRPGEISLLLYSLAKLREPPQEVLQELLLEATGKLRSFQPQELTNTVYALSRMGTTPGEKWLMQFTEVSYTQLGAFKTVELANTVLALARLGHEPDVYWIEAFFKESFHKFSSFNPREVANMLFGLGLMGAKPDQEWLSMCTNYTYQRISDFQVPELKRAVWALAQFDHVPNDTWQEQYVTRFLQQLPKCNAEDMVTILGSMAYLRFNVGGVAPNVWERVVGQCDRVRRFLQPEDLQSLNRSLNALGCRIPVSAPERERFVPAGRQ